MNVELLWSDFKSLIAKKNRQMQYWDDGNYYRIFFSEIETIYTCIIPISDPASEDQSDFEDNYKSGCNLQQQNMPIFSEVILKTGEQALTSRTETDMTDATFTVTTGKKFFLVFYGANADCPLPVVFRLKVNNVTKYRLAFNGRDANNSDQFIFSPPVKIGDSGDVIKVTVESSYKSGTVWAAFSGVEY